MADTMAVGTTLQYPANYPTTFVIPVVCTAAANGTFTTRSVAKADVGFDYTKQGLVLAHMFAVNDATTYAASGAITISDALGQELVGSAVSDAFTLSTSASGVTHLSNTRDPLARQVISLLSIAITDTGAAANILTLYLILAKYSMMMR